MFIQEKEFHGRKFSIETSRIAKQAGGSVIVRFGDSIVLVTACSGAEKDGDFLPLTIDYVEKTYAAGKIPGGFFKREGKLSERETLISRLMDRPCRPMFVEGFNKEVQVVATVLSADPDNDTDVLAVTGASAALTLSDLPFEGPLAAVRVGRIAGKLVINPTYSELATSDLNYVVAGTKDAIVMVEGGSKEVPEKEIIEALFFAHKELQTLIQMQEALQKQAGKPKLDFVPKARDEDAIAKITKFLAPRIDKAIRIKDKLERRDAFRAMKVEAAAEFIKEGDENAAKTAGLISKVFEDASYRQVRDMVTKEGKRIDGRDTTTVRPITIELGILPRCHGSALFTRGETQAIVVTTLGTTEEAQRLDNIAGETTKTFMLHYNFPPFSVGETKPMRGPGRREVGHGALAERAVQKVMPNIKEFPYVTRIVSEITESNGSSSMATVCGSSLSLMDAGVPLKKPVAGVAMGLIKEDGKYAILTDILGDEDHLGDMDFKVCGTDKGITALQMDIKIKGLEREIMDKALNQAKDARLFILGQMAEAINAPRTSMSPFAPRIVSLKINPEKIRDIIGPGGKTIRSITESCGVKMEVLDDGTVNIASNDEKKTKAAIDIVKSLTQEAEIGKIYKGVVKRIADFGAFVEILPGTDGLVHISQLTDERVREVRDVLQEGDEVYVKVLDVDRQGKIRLSRKEAMDEMKNQGQAQGN
ncbi:MAG: polyribonucleotide nucleotidyltransferase [Deltaproteobacteria bacterium]|nr:polyribonucleotide nucleotidyltransferase [Deltaproteobacteria bacterium]